MVRPDEPVFELKLAVEDATGIPPDMRKLALSSWHLEDGRTLSDYGIQKESVVGVLLGLRGGGGGKKQEVNGIVVFGDSKFSQ